MLCEICHENEARITYTEIINGVKKEQHLCEKCAAKQSPFSNISGNFKLGPDVPFGNILSGLLQSFAKGLGAMQEKESICGRCGTTASEFAKTGRLGCPNCYAAFAPILDKNLRTLQGAIENKGKRPMNAVYFEPVKYDPSAVPGGKDRDSEEMAGSVIGTAGTIDDILGMPDNDETGTAGKGRKKAGEAAGRVSGRTKKNTGGGSGTGRSKKAADSEETGRTKKTAGSKSAETKGTGKTVKSAGAGKTAKTAGAGAKSEPSKKKAQKAQNAGTGKKPDTAEIAALRRKMDKAVKAEDYEEAAKLRDRIHELEKTV